VSDRTKDAGQNSALLKKRIAAFLILLVGLGAVVALFFFWKAERKTVPVKPVAQKIDFVAPAPGVSAPLDTVKVTKDIHEEKIEAKKPLLLRHDTSTPATTAAVESTPPSAPVDTVADTAGTESYTMALESDSAKCGGDTSALWVYPEPSGGLHHGAIAVSFHGNKPCTVFWRMEPDTAWRQYSDAPLSIGKTGTLVFKALGPCGRAMETRQEYYEIAPPQTSADCPKGMDLVKIGSTRFCIDRYEWPNRKGSLPLSYVSLYQAMDSCYAAGKRLCSSEEWSLACSGPFSWKYPYGQNYEHNACVTVDTSVRLSGSKPECRAYFGSFDMAGNLLEWTATTAKENTQLYNVMGGFWESGSRSGCFDIRYSYYPQNRHNPVGFRCCKDAAPGRQ
jgi:hypothetical protein